MITFEQNDTQTTVRRNDQYFGKILSTGQGFNAIGLWFNVTVSTLALAKECFLPAKLEKKKIDLNTKQIKLL